MITACQCFPYFDHEVLAPKLSNMLKKGGKFVVLYMAWLPFEDEIAGKSEELVLKYNPSWTGCGETRHAIEVPEVYHKYFKMEQSDIFDLMVPFCRDSWNGQMKSCRGIGASLETAESIRFEQEHKELLRQTAPEEFSVLHYAAAVVMETIA